MKIAPVSANWPMLQEFYKQLAHALHRHGVDIWLGHESLDTTQIYLAANLQLQEAIFKKMNPQESKPGDTIPTTNC